MNLLWLFAFFVLVPILVHLFDFRKAKKYYFSSVKYISGLNTKSKSQSRIKYFLILTNRVLLFVAVIVCIIGLSSKESSFNDSPFTIYYDNSTSSEISNGIEVVKKILDQLPKNRLTNGYFYNNNDKVSLSGEMISSLIDVGTTSASVNLSKLNNSQYSNEAIEFFIVSDFQQFDADQALSLVSDTSDLFHFYLLEDLNAFSNVSVDRLQISPNPHDLSKLSVNIGFDAFNMESGSVVIKFLQENKQISSLVKNVSELAQVNFDIPIDSYGTYQIVLDGDDILYDNIFQFVISERKRPNVVIFNNSEKNYISTAFTNPKLFETENLDLNNLDYKSLKAADLIVFNNLEELPSSFLSQFTDAYFLIFPSSNATTKSYQEFMSLRIGKSDEFNSEIDIEEQHPLFRGVFSSTVNRGLMPSLPLVFNIEGDYEPIIKYRNGSPFLLKSQNTLLFNTTLSEASSFQSNALFLPLLYQIAFSSTNEMENTYFYPGDLIQVGLKVTESPLKIRNENLELIPEFNTGTDQIIVKIPENIDPGIYQLVQGESILKDIAVNVPKAESIMRSLTIDEMKSFFSDYKNVQVHKASSNANDILLASSSGISFWKYALILVLVFIVSETMLHRYFR